MMWDAGFMSEGTEPAGGASAPRVPFEQPVDRIPPQYDQEQIKLLVTWADLIHEHVRDPWGISWAALRTSLRALESLMVWAEHADHIDPLYRYRIDAPMDPEELLKQLGDTLPEGWGDPSPG